MDELRVKPRVTHSATNESHSHVDFRMVAIYLIACFALYIGLGGYFKDTNDKISSIDKRIDFVLFQNQTYEKNMKALAGTSCASCHLVPAMVLPKSSLSIEQFSDYVRGDKRFNTNSQMPKFDNSMISDAELEKIWKGLY